MSKPDYTDAKAREWRRRLLQLVSGLLIFETLSGLSIYLLPFSVTNQVMVLVHTLGGIAFLAPYAWYQYRHWQIYRRMPMTHVKLTGYLSMVAAVVALVTGVVLTVQAIFGSRIGYGWDLAHIISTFAIIAAAGGHVLWIIWRNLKARHVKAMAPIIAAQKRYGVSTLFLAAVMFAIVALGAYALYPVERDHSFPDDYVYTYGEDRPFAPSLARTESGGTLQPEAMGGSQTCGRSGCHVEIVKEWEVSAHRWAAMDPAFRAVQRIMGEQNGPETTRYCGGCHDPISLFSGTKNLYRDDLTNPIGFDEGVSCISCHAIKETDVKGNANYVIAQPERYLFELQESKVAAAVSDFLIRSYPKKHVESLQHKMFKSPEFCAGCHKQFIDEEINNVGWVQLQNQYDNWRKSRWNHPGDPRKTVECRECHMPLVDSFDPAAGDDLDYNRTPDDRKHRSHRFLGANQFVPSLLKLPGAAEQDELTTKWLRGEIDIPEIAHKWKEGPAVPIEVIAPNSALPGEEITLEVRITNNKLGHDFPTGPLDIIQAWVEVVVTDADGTEVYVSGRRDEDFFIQTGSFMFKAEPVDRYGNLIDRHNLWEMVGVRYRRALFPGFSDRAMFQFSCPGSASGEGSEPLPERQELAFRTPGDRTGELFVSARLLYRKVDQFLLNELFGKDSGVTAPVTEVSSDTTRIRIGHMTATSAP